MPKHKNEDLRRHPRSKSGFAGVVETPGLLNHVDNISCSGVLCHTLQPVPLMTKMSIALELPDTHRRRIEAEGIVVRCDHDEQASGRFSLAILFSRLKDDDFEAIKSYVEHDLAHAVVDD